MAKYKTIYLDITYFLSNNIIPFFVIEKQNRILLDRRLVILRSSKGRLFDLPVQSGMHFILGKMVPNSLCLNCNSCIWQYKPHSIKGGAICKS